MADIIHLLTIKAPAKKVYKAITEQKGLSNWWTKQVKAVPEKNTTAEFNFGSKDHNEMLVTDLIKDKKVEWKCTAGDKEWVGTKFLFELEEKNEKTILRFSHKDWKKATDFFASCNYHWGWYMNSLKKYCETGKGIPYPDSIGK